MSCGGCGDCKCKNDQIIKKPIVIEGCIGCGSCMAVAGEVFEFDDEGMSVVIDGVDYSKHTDSIDTAISICPVNVIKWKE